MVNKGISQHDSLVILPKVFAFKNTKKEPYNFVLCSDKITFSWLKDIV